MTEPVEDPATRRERLVEVYREASGCTRCPLAGSRTQVVFGAGHADADLMFVGEAPGAEEDRQGLPFVGRAGGLLNQLLEGIAMKREEVFIANVLKCLGYDAMVQLGDGSWERIGRLVGSRYAGEVMSVDAGGHLVPRRVTGRHASPLGDRRVFRLTYRSARDAGAARAGTELTGDHPVLTERGFTPVERLAPGDRIATGQGLSAPASDGPPQVQYDEVELEDITEQGRADRTFFCIDVEETHNFVTGGGVVHNCRPPANRDPQPPEIESCRPWLDQQVGLIRPRVIGTLGNFSTKLLTGNPAGITRVRGTPQVHELGGLPVFLMPLVHPAAALRTPKLVDVLREDFARLRSLLEEPRPALPEPHDAPAEEQQGERQDAQSSASQLDLLS